jgi:hypothetical protein
VWKRLPMRTIAKAVIATAFLGSTACSAPSFAQQHYQHHRYWHRYWGSPYGYAYRRYNPDLHCTLAGCCPVGWTAHDGVCKPYRGY